MSKTVVSSNGFSASRIAGVATGLVFFAGAQSAAIAGDYYISGSGSVVFQEDSTNEGAFVGPFSTGNGGAIPAGTVLQDGSAVGWDTDFNTGFAISGAVGKYYGPFRGEFEVAYQNAGVDTHTGVSAGPTDLSGFDAAVLISDRQQQLGVTVADLVADGQGDLETIFLMANAIYDFDLGSPIKPYIGGGVGVGFVNVDYVPSATTVIDDRSTQFAYQAMAGVSYAVAPAAEVFVGYRYRATTDVSVEANLFTADFDIENSASMAEAGIRLKF
ncbi:MAG: P44/Msp2 family outer membrane protein [Pseudomonadota bacterium]